MPPTVPMPVSAAPEATVVVGEEAIEPSTRSVPTLTNVLPGIGAGRRKDERARADFRQVAGSGNRARHGDHAGPESIVGSATPGKLTGCRR